jgi:anaerobic selenocysteine-containing dehydrogenase
VLQEVDLVVVVDQFMTATARAADIVLPATTCLEQWDLHVSYWHHYASITEQAVAPLYEARSDLAIARALSAKLNQLSPGFSAFPTEGDEREWVQRELEQPATRGLVPGTVDDLRQAPLRLNLPETAWNSGRFDTPSGRIELWSEAALADGLSALPVYRAPVPPPPAYPVRLLTPHRAEGLHSQFADQTGGLARPVLEIHPALAVSYRLTEGARVRAYNARGELRLPVRLTRTVPPDTVVAYEGVFADPSYNVNLLTEPTLPESGFPGVAYGDCFVALEPAPEEE